MILAFIKPIIVAGLLWMRNDHMTVRTMLRSGTSAVYDLLQMGQALDTVLRG